MPVHGPFNGRPGGLVDDALALYSKVKAQEDDVIVGMALGIRTSLHAIIRNLYVQHDEGHTKHVHVFCRHGCSSFLSS